MPFDLASLTTALLRLIDDGNGTAEIVDPDTNRVLRITEAPPVVCVLSDDEIREELEETRADIRGGRITTGSKARLNQ